jgi:hypothetical protein
VKNRWNSAKFRKFLMENKISSSADHPHKKQKVTRAKEHILKFPSTERDDLIRLPPESSTTAPITSSLDLITASSCTTILCGIENQPVFISEDDNLSLQVANVYLESVFAGLTSAGDNFISETDGSARDRSQLPAVSKDPGLDEICEFLFSEDW